MSRSLSFLACVLLLSACSAPDPVLPDADALQLALSTVNNTSFTAELTSYTEANDSRATRFVQIEWMASHAATDSTSSAAWTLYDREEDEEDYRIRYHLWQNTVTSIANDSTRTTSAFDAQNADSDNGIPNYYTSLMLPTMLGDTAWVATQVSDSLVEVTWTHIPAKRGQAERLVVTATDRQDTTDTDFHVDTRSEQRWTFEAPSGLPVEYVQSWYRGDMAYGSDMAIAFSYEKINSEDVTAGVSEWTAPEWTHEPAPSDNEVAGGGDDDWFEKALEALPAVETPAPAIEGTLLTGDKAALTDFAGKLVYLDFWYIGCGPCMRALPHLAGMQEEFGPEGFTVLGVNHHQDSTTVKRYLDRRALEIPQLLLDSLPEGYPVVAYPTWLLVGRDGNIIERDMGYGPNSGTYLDSLVQANL